MSKRKLSARYDADFKHTNEWHECTKNALMAKRQAKVDVKMIVECVLKK